MASTSATAQKDEIAYDPEIAKNISPEPTESADSDDAGDSDGEVDLEAEVHVNCKPEGRKWYNSLSLSSKLYQFISFEIYSKFYSK